MATTVTIAGLSTFELKYSADATHFMYGRIHTKPKKAVSSLFPDGRTLFIVNVPPDATERELSVFFKQYGMIEKVIFEDNRADEEGGLESSESEDESDTADDAEQDTEMRDAAAPSHKRKKGRKDKPPVVKPLQIPFVRQLRRSGSTAHVVFLDGSSLDNVFAQPLKSCLWPPTTEASIPNGLAHYMARYSAIRPSLSNVREHADTAIQAYDYAQARLKQKSKYKKGEAIVDEDGFTLVTRGGAYGKTLGGGVAVVSKRFVEEQDGKRAKKKKKISQGKDGFYGFQVHEKKRKELLDLKRKFEEDKVKITKLKASRTFKPY